ncbi:hypothetical protein LTR17_020443 [Elasticomyces elasticus]|nr:hypothetical protein LTR17_020443 [Elasticomyces elasticus]
MANPAPPIIPYPGVLTRGCILYEGNYAEWQERVDGLLEIHDFEVWDFNYGLWIYPDALCTLRTSLAMSLIKPSVSAALMNRVPVAQRDNVNELLGSLKALAKPFRLNDLPPELRARIYGFHFGQAVRYITTGGPREWAKQSPSKLLLVSRATRAEALPIFFDGLEVRFVGPRTPLENFADTERSILSWVETNVKEDVKYLRRLRIEVPVVIGGKYDITVTFSMQTGLRAEYSSELPDKRRQRWEKHIKKIEASRKALGLQGEAIIMAVTTKAEIWGSGPP